MKRLGLFLGTMTLVAIVMAIVLGFLGGCKEDTEVKPVEAADWTWYAPDYPVMSDPGLGDNLEVWDWGSLLPDTEERVLDAGEFLEIAIKGNLPSGSIVVSPSARNIFQEGWGTHILRIYNDHVKVTLPQGKGSGKDSRLLPNGNYSGIGKDSIWEVDAKTGEIIREVEAKGASHEAALLDNGNILIVANKLSKVWEQDWEGNVTWIWDAEKEVVPFDEDTYNSHRYNASIKNIYYEYHEKETTWMAPNRAQALDNGWHLIEFRNQDLVVVFDQRNVPVWTFGPMVLKHPHGATILPKGNLLIHDTGNGRVLEVTPEQKIIWEFPYGQVSPYHGTAQRLPNGDTLISDSFRSSIWAVTPEGNIRWEIVIRGKSSKVLTREEAGPEVKPGVRIYRAWWYE